MILLLSLALAVGFANEDWTDKMSEILSLRKGLETQTFEFEQVKGERVRELDGLRATQQELQAQLQREQQKAMQLKLKKEALSRLVKKDSAPVKDQRVTDQQILALIDQMTETIDKGLQYKQGERKNALLNLRRRMAEQGLSQAYTLSELWQILDKETALLFHTKKEMIAIGEPEKPQFVEIARLGLRQAYALLPEGKVGVLGFGSTPSTLMTVLTEEREQQAVKRLFTKLESNNGQGFFELPKLQERSQ